jgi:hypothetical protein
MLEIDPVKRISLKDALDHPFFKYGISEKEKFFFQQVVEAFKNAGVKVNYEY